MLGAAVVGRLGLGREEAARQLAAALGEHALNGAVADHLLQTGDFRKQVVLRFLRTLSKSKIQDAMRESLAGADPKTLDQFVSYFPEVKEGEQCVLRYLPGGKLESIMAGQQKPTIDSKAFADQLFGLYVGPKPIQDDIKAGVVARAGEALK